MRYATTNNENQKYARRFGQTCRRPDRRPARRSAMHARGAAHLLSACETDSSSLDTASDDAASATSLVARDATPRRAHALRIVAPADITRPTRTVFVAPQALHYRSRLAYESFSLVGAGGGAQRSVAAGGVRLEFLDATRVDVSDTDAVGMLVRGRSLALADTPADTPACAQSISVASSSNISMSRISVVAGGGAARRCNATVDGLCVRASSARSALAQHAAAAATAAAAAVAAVAAAASAMCRLWRRNSPRATSRCAPPRLLSSGRSVGWPARRAARRTC